MEIQEPIKLAMSQSPESWKKRLTSQPLNGSSTITIGTSSSSQTRIEIPSCCNYIGDIEIGYQMALSNSIATTVLPFMSATSIPEIQRIEMYFADSTSKLIDIQNFNIYSRMTTPLFNDYKKRTISQRVCFQRDIGCNFVARDYGDETVSTAGVNGCMVNAGDKVTYASQQQYVQGLKPINPQPTVNTYVSALSPATSSYSDGYFSDSVSRGAGAALMVPPNDSTQQEYLPMGYFSGSVGAITLYPYQYNFNFKLKDVIHDSILSNLKCMYHRTNLVIIIYWQPVTQILFQVPTNVACANGLITHDANKNGTPDAFNLQGITLNITNFFVRYYSEVNPMLCEQIKNATYEIAYPFLYQYNMSLEPGVSSGSVLGGNLIIGNEGASRIYRIYTSLQGTKGTYLPADNFGNIQYKKWNNLMELYINNDLIERLTAAYGDWDATMRCFKDGSVNSSIALQNLGTIAYHFDSDTKNGSVNEYDDNVLKGKLCDQFCNINSRMTGLGSDGGSNTTASYTIWIYAVIIRKAIIDKGEMKLV